VLVIVTLTSISSYIFTFTRTCSLYVCSLISPLSTAYKGTDAPQRLDSFSSSWLTASFRFRRHFSGMSRPQSTDNDWSDCSVCWFHTVCSWTLHAGTPMHKFSLSLYTTINQSPGQHSMPLPNVLWCTDLTTNTASQYPPPSKTLPQTVTLIHNWCVKCLTTSSLS